MNLEAIKQAIVRLPDDDRHSLAVWLNEFEYDDWDKQMSADFSPGGRGMHVLDKVSRDIAEGKAVPLEDGPGDTQRRPK